MTNWLVMIEAINFSATLFDVDDLSAIRGGGEAMLAVPRWLLDQLNKTPDFSGRCTILQAAASRAIARITLPPGENKERDAAAIVAAIDQLRAASSAGAARSAKAGDMLTTLLPQLPPHLTFTIAAVPESEGLVALEKAVRLSQMRRFSVDVPSACYASSVSTNRPCTQDWVRPRHLSATMPDGKPSDVSLSVALRRQLGRTGRRDEFYQRILTDAGIGVPLPSCGFAHEFGELVENPSAIVPAAVAGKMLLVSLDANSMSSIRAKAMTSAETAAEFALAFKAMRARFLLGLLTWAAAQPYMLLTNPKREKVDGEKRTLPVLRLETLVWGADEMAFVLPAWALEPLLIQLSHLLDAKHWTFDTSLGGETVTHGIGLVVASAKAPVRSLRALAETLQDDAKAVDRAQSMLQYWVAGSIDMPTRNLQNERAALFDIEAGDGQSHAFTLPLNHVVGGMALLRRIKGESGNKAVGIPRQKLSDLCQVKRDKEATRQALGDLLAKGGYADEAGQTITADEVFDCEFFAGTAAKGEERIRFRHMLELWSLVGLIPSGTGTDDTTDQGEPA